MGHHLAKPSSGAIKVPSSIEVVTNVDTLLKEGGVGVEGSDPLLEAKGSRFSPAVRVKIKSIADGFHKDDGRDAVGGGSVVGEAVSNDGGPFPISDRLEIVGEDDDFESLFPCVDVAEQSPGFAKSLGMEREVVVRDLKICVGVGELDGIVSFGFDRPAVADMVNHLLDGV